MQRSFSSVSRFFLSCQFCLFRLSRTDKNENVSCFYELSLSLLDQSSGWIYNFFHSTFRRAHKCPRDSVIFCAICLDHKTSSKNSIGSLRIVLVSVGNFKTQIFRLQWSSRLRSLWMKKKLKNIRTTWELISDHCVHCVIWHSCWVN